MSTSQPARFGNYHINSWDDPPTYVCLLCQDAQGVPKEAVMAHVREVHQVEPVPSIMMADMEARYAARKQEEADAQAHAAQTAQSQAPPPTSGPADAAPL